MDNTMDIEETVASELHHPITGEALALDGDMNDVVPVLAEWLEQAQEMADLAEKIRRFVEGKLPANRMSGRIEGGGYVLAGERNHGRIQDSALELAHMLQGALPSDCRPIEVVPTLRYKLSRTALNKLRGTAGPNAEAVLKALDDGTLRPSPPRVKISSRPD